MDLGGGGGVGVAGGGGGAAFGGRAWVGGGAEADAAVIRALIEEVRGLQEEVARLSRANARLERDVAEANEQAAAARAGMAAMEPRLLTEERVVELINARVVPTRAVANAARDTALAAQAQVGALQPQLHEVVRGLSHLRVERFVNHTYGAGVPEPPFVFDSRTGFGVLVVHFYVAETCTTWVRIVVRVDGRVVMEPQCRRGQLAADYVTLSDEALVEVEPGPRHVVTLEWASIPTNATYDMRHNYNRVVMTWIELPRLVAPPAPPAPGPAAAAAADPVAPAAAP